MEEIKFISVDSSLSNTGIAVGRIIDGEIVVDEILLNSSKKKQFNKTNVAIDTIQRCKSSYVFLKAVTKWYKPDVAFVETPSGSQNASSAKSYGSTCQLLGTIRLPTFYVTPKEVKENGVGQEGAEKKEIIDWAYNKFPEIGWHLYRGELQNKNEHMADAIAIAFAGIKTKEYKKWKESIV